MKKLKESYQAKFGIKSPLRGYQLKAAKVGVDNPSFALLMDPRLGKTRVAIAVMGYRRLNQGINRAVVICPSIAKDVWANELRDTLALPHRVTVIEGKRDERRALLTRWKDEPGKLSIILVNHEATWRLKRWLYKLNAEMVIVDESHRIKNRASKQSKSIQTLGNRGDYHCIMTGTFMAEPSDAYSQFKFLDPSILGSRWKEDFCAKYVKTWGFGGHKPATYHNLDDLEARVSSVAFKLTREEAGGFPEEMSQVFHFDLSPVARKHYLEMEETLKTLVNEHTVKAPIVLTQLLRLQQITGGFLPVLEPDEDLPTNQAIGSERITALKELVNEYPLDEPLVVFARFRYEVTQVEDSLRKMGRTVNHIVGGMKDRDQAKRDFQGGVVSTCVVQVKAGGIAIDLSRASTEVFYSMTGSYFDYEQARARIISRRGGRVSTLHLVARDTVDEDTLETVMRRKGLSDLIMGRLKKIS
jgi:SNF2 family DNA or RNA helicase